MEGAPTLISNLEVMLMLQERVQKTAKNSRQNQRRYQHRNWIQEQVVAFLENTPCAKLDQKRYGSLLATLQGKKKRRLGTTASSPSSKNSNTQTTGYGLTQAEAIQILNNVPSEPVEIHLMIEELQSRMSDQKQQELLKLVTSYRNDGDNDNDGQAAIVKMEENGAKEHAQEEEEIVEEDPAEEQPEAVSSSSSLLPVKQEPA